MIVTIGTGVESTPVNPCQRFVQREFPWLSAMPSPVDAPRCVLAACTSAADALNVSIAARKFSAAKYADLLGVSPSFMSLMRHGERPIPEWFVKPLCALTGTNLLSQWFALQGALDSLQRTPERVRIERLAASLRSAA